MSTPAAARWARLIDKHEASGLSIREFARIHRVKPGTLSWWRWNLRRTRPRRSEATFIELTVEPPEPVSAEPLTLILDELDVRIEVHPASDLQLLKRVLEALC